MLWSRYSLDIKCPQVFKAWFLSSGFNLGEGLGYKGSDLINGFII